MRYETRPDHHALQVVEGSLAVDGINRLRVFDILGSLLCELILQVLIAIGLFVVVDKFPLFSKQRTMLMNSNQVTTMLMNLNQVTTLLMNSNQETLTVSRQEAQEKKGRQDSREAELIFNWEKTIVLVLGLATGGLWKMHHWNEQRKIRTFSDLLEKGEISVVAEE
ncbi:uncharacterized protein LOC112166260 [Rosa chinensis]|uniref:uncharacterized protein LOC112166260 n=1 Tax=Rosa chinensis TaxID=74649 RepID=UPI001AD8C0EA|nr:uncharacterized protein LOC112166260 [Rosa chinensis]